MKKILTLLLLAAFSFASVSCDDYLDVNKNVDAPDHIEAPLYLSGALAAWEGVYWDGRALNPLASMCGNSNYTSYGSHFYSKASDSAAEMWRVTYWLQGKNVENMINQALEDKCYTLAGIGYAIKAYSWDFLTKMHGDAPILEAFKDGVSSFPYDMQPVIYDKIKEWADLAIELLKKENECGDAYLSDVAKADILYGGNAEKWTKFANGVMVRNLSSLTNKADFKTKYFNDLLTYASNALQSNADNAAMATEGGRGEAQFSNYNNSWGPYRGTGSDSHFPTNFAVQVMTGTMPVYDPATGDKIKAALKPGETTVDKNFPYELAAVQYVTDTSDAVGHFDPRVTAKIGTTDARKYDQMDDVAAIKKWYYKGGTETSWSGTFGTAANLWGSRAGYNSSSSVDGDGRWLYRNNAPYILMTASEMQFCVAEAQFKYGEKAAALAAFKKGIALDLEFTASYLVPGAPKETGKDDDGNPIYANYGAKPGGDVIKVDTFKKLANEYLAGPYVEGITTANLTLSHIMLQKFVALFPYGAGETWVDMRKHHYDIKYSGEYPSLNNGWTLTTVEQKWDTDETKVYKGFYLLPAQVEGRRGTYNIENHGSPCYRIRPRYNSEYMWNLTGLNRLYPIKGTDENYQCSIPWFAYPGEYPQTIN